MQTTTPPDTIPESPKSPGVAGRPRTPLLLAALAVLVVAAAAIWWLAIRDGGSAAGPISFTFIDSCWSSQPPDNPRFADEGPQATFLRCEISETSDPRWSGTVAVSYSSSTKSYGINEVTNEGGTWEGSWEWRGNTGIVKSVARGTGDYEGLQARTSKHDSCGLTNCEWTGTIEPIP